VTDAAYITRAGVPLAYRHRPGAGPTIVFLPGYTSDMLGSKAEALDAWAAARGRAFLRLDYAGCGESGGAFEDGTFSGWRDDALAVIDAVAPGPVVLVGSSMGGWLALLIARDRPRQVAALVGIAAAPDFCDWGTLAGRDGPLELPNPYGPDPYRYTAALLADGRANRLLPGPIAYDGRVRLLQGQADREVPWTLALDTAAALGSADVQVTLVKDGDHRLSRPQDLALLTATLDRLLETS
jgi:pimeloyl-ACP methyl ester carboxylesterase